MDDLRCADPDLQLDVDTMILEYTIFRAIEAQFQLLYGDASAEPEKAALRPLLIFNSFIQIFNEHHPDHEHSPEIIWQLDILEFLVLLCAVSYPSCPFLTDATKEQVRERAKGEVEARRKWLAMRERHFRRLEKQPAATTPSFSPINVSRDVEDQICAAWENNQTATPCPEPQITDALLLFSLLPRFMTISAKFWDMMDESDVHPNENWMKVACELMLRASLEILQLRTKGLQSDSLPSLEDCFAWGYIEPSPCPDDDRRTVTTPSDPEIAELINLMFRSSTPSTTTTSTTKSTSAPQTVWSENPQWTTLRTETLSEFCLAPDSSTSSQSSRLDRLSDKYPRAQVTQKLVTFVQSIWTLCRDEELFDKPVLVELEEGHLKSRGIDSGVEFEAFAARVGLYSSVAVCPGDASGTSASPQEGILDIEKYMRELEQRGARRESSTVVNGITYPVIKLED